ncbi:MAG: WecB/TagA/CpsF family glycosyltransferase [Spirochaetales bacterium]|nr:MAG: WecB/TagA/CpsF family glycosyltransferase [Spirochaetales bacterium]
MERSVITRKKRVDFLRVPIDILSGDDLEESVKEMLASKEFHQIVLLNLKGLLRARRNMEFLYCLKHASLVLPVSGSIVRGAKFLRRGALNRFMPFDFTIKLLGILEKYKHTLYLLGHKKELLVKAETNLRASFPDIRLVGRFNGYFPKQNQKDILTAVKKASPSLLLAGGGLPKKNLWIYSNRKNFNPGIFMWAGPCFDVFSGKKSRPSRQLWEKGLDFLPALLSHPWRIVNIFVYLYYWIILLIYRIGGL